MPRENIRRIMLVGEQNVGKTSIISYLMNNRKFSVEHYPSVGVQAGILAEEIPLKNDQHHESSQTKKQLFIVQLWDTAGKHDLHEYICEKFYDQIDGFVIVTDLKNLNTLKSVNYWTQKINSARKGNKNYKLAVIANKSDTSQPEFSQKEFRKNYPEIKIYEEISLIKGQQSRENQHVSEAFRKIIREVYGNQQPLVIYDEEKSTTNSNCTCLVM